MAKFKCTFNGTTPLLLHNARLSDPFDPFVRAMKAITDKGSRNMTDDDRIELARLEFNGGIYHDDELGPYLPSKYIAATLLASAALTRHRPALSRSGPVMDALKYQLQYEGPRDLETLWDGGTSPFVSRESIVVNRARTMRTRPVFNDWGIEFTIELDERELSPDVFADIAIRSGTKTGLGDWRPNKNGSYGRYAVTVDEL